MHIPDYPSDITNDVQRRAQKVDSSRQLDLFADLSLGPSDDDEENEIVREGVAPFVSMVGSSSS
jgi:snurportin-1